MVMPSKAHRNSNKSVGKPQPTKAPAWQAPDKHAGKLFLRLMGLGRAILGFSKQSELNKQGEGEETKAAPVKTALRLDDLKSQTTSFMHYSG
jgi:hypothetical protein